MERNAARRGITLIVVGMTAVVLLGLSLSVRLASVSASRILAAPLCGEGSAPDYGFTYDLQQAHWTVGWQGFASEEAVSEVDEILDRLNGDSIAQTMILIKRQAEVGNRVNCAVHFLRYMKLGLQAGERKDNGFVFLIVVEPTRIDVHYGVGLGLPALTAYELTTLNRAAEDAYQSTHSLDQALLTLVREFDTVARNNYAPLKPSTSFPEEDYQPQLPSGPQGILMVCVLSCMGIFFLIFMMWMFSQLGRMGTTFNPYGSGNPYGAGNPYEPGYPYGTGWRGRMGFPSGGVGRSSSPTRGGSGSGRSGRGN